jgi:hypothetical protein
MKAKRGFTLTEVMFASSIAFVVSAGVMSTFIWTGRQNQLCSRIAWSQTEAMRSSGKIESLVRNAVSIAAIDEAQGNWVEVRFADGTTNRLDYYHEPDSPREGNLVLSRTNATELLLARGLTRIMTTSGFPTPVFTKINDRALRICYRVSEPGANGKRNPNDGPYSACARFAVCLRNAPY